MERIQSDIEAIESVAAWLGGLGLGHGSDRLHSYVREIRKQAPLPSTAREIAEIGFIHVEASEFVSLHRAYSGAENSQLIAKLERALRGCHILADESTKNNDARNTMFELVLAANLKLRGVDVELGEPDLTINFPKGQYVVECKRPFKESSVRANVKDAEGQLAKVLGPGQNGVIAISLNRIINPGDSVLSVEVGDRDKAGAVHGTMQAALHRRCYQLMSAFATLNFSPRTAALMFNVSTPFLTEKGEGVAQGFSLYPTDEPRSASGKLRGVRPFTAAFAYLEDKMDEVLKNEFTPEGQAEIEDMNRIARVPGFFAAVSKK